MTEHSSSAAAVSRAIKFFQTQRAMADALGISPVAVGQWLQREGGKKYRPVPPKQAVRIEQLTGGGVTRRELRPEDWQEIWPELASDQETADA